MKKVPPLIWWECIKKVWEVDPLLCSKCGGLMKPLRFVYEKKVIKKIFEHLDIYEEVEPKRKRGPPVFVEQVDPHTKPFDDGRPEYNEPCIDVRMV